MLAKQEATYVDLTLSTEGIQAAADKLVAIGWWPMVGAPNRLAYVVPRHHRERPIQPVNLQESLTPS
ncbi:hypothetical protein EPH_0004590 [Eimeria praecox]|uniref:Uncharacterized protein n=1 Tax=Eimeria praecox TaxID=51316 RepID=U6G6T3_9EIME|nr:hypothetical protein EPH_0004590 [Eimeria praecox]